jgi:thymidylate synthase (FAD)
MNSLQLIGEDTYDFATTLTQDHLEGLLDGGGYVRLVDFSPRIIRKGYTPEAGMIQAARTSYGMGLKDPITDKKLVEYLFYNDHSSPIEFCDVTLSLKIPQVIGVHILRHRTGKFNVFSGRYSLVDEDMGFYNPLLYSEGIRFQDSLNKQGSSPQSSDMEKLEEKSKQKEIEDLMEEANALQRRTVEIYTKLVKEHKVAKEIARFWLPQSQYQTMYIKFDVSNLIKMLYLRTDSHAQRETQVYANAIEELCAPLFPTIFAAYRNRKMGMRLSLDEIEAFCAGRQIEDKSKSRREEFQRKSKRLRGISSE